MAGERLGFLQFHAAFIEEATLSRAEDVGRDERGDTAGHVHHTAAGKVDHANAKERIGRISAQETSVGPNRMNDDGVHKA